MRNPYLLGPNRPRGGRRSTWPSPRVVGSPPPGPPKLSTWLGRRFSYYDTRLQRTLESFHTENLYATEHFSSVYLYTRARVRVCVCIQGRWGYTHIMRNSAVTSLLKNRRRINGDREGNDGSRNSLECGFPRSSFCHTRRSRRVRNRETKN